MRRRGVIVVSLALLGFVGCRRPAAPASRSWSEMGTFCSVSVPATAADRLHELSDISRSTVSNLNALLTVYRDDSEISRVNAAAGTSPIAVSTETHEMLALCLHYGALTGGAFDPTVGAIVRRWGFNDGTAPDEPLTEDVIREAMRGLGYDQLRLSAGTASLGNSRAQLDLGGIAKGYAVDACYRRAIEAGATDVMINIGGNIRCGGLGRPGRPWVIGVRNPFDREDVIGMLSLTGGEAIATSGNYERFVTIGGKRYAHIIDPRSGRPVEGMAGVTIIASTAVEADALSTAVFVMGIDEGASLVRSLPGCEALFVPDRQPLEIHVTPGFRKRLEVLPSFAGAVHVIGDS